MDHHAPTDNQKETNSIELLKKWHRSGFISFSLWNSADKVIIEIGSTDPDNNNALKQVTKCFLPAVQFLTYLHSEVNGIVTTIFPTFTDKGISFFGGSVKPPVVSRVFNSSYYKDYKNNNAVDTYHRTFRCAHYDGEVKDKGAVQPIYTKKISENTIKLSLLDLAEMYQLLNLHMIIEGVVDEMKENNL